MIIFSIAYVFGVVIDEREKDKQKMMPKEINISITVSVFCILRQSMVFNTISFFVYYRTVGYIDSTLLAIDNSKAKYTYTYTKLGNQWDGDREKDRSVYHSHSEKDKFSAKSRARYEK